MELIPIQDDVLVNPEKISVIEVTRRKNGGASIRVTVENKNFEVTKAPDEFLRALNRSGVDLSKQFFSV